MKVYKLTDQNGMTHGNTKWGPMVTNGVEGKLKFCNNGIHSYTDPLLAVLLNPIHANTTNPILWECDGNDEHLDDHGLNLCHRSLTTTREISVPVVTTMQHTKFGILCAQQIAGDACPAWSEWAEKWLSDKDRSREAAREAAIAAAMATAIAAARARWAAAGAAWAAVWAAWEVREVREVVWVTREAAWAAAAVAREVVTQKKLIDLIALARQAMEVE